MNRPGRTVLAAAFVLVFVAIPSSLRAAWGAECLSLPSRILNHPVAYCVLLPPSYQTEKTRRYPVLYYLHGLGDNQQMFLRAGGMNLVQDLWEQKGIGEFLIVTPDADASFYVNSHDGKERYEDFLLREFLPQIEKRYRTIPGRKSRGIAGISMGGYGALHLAFRHPELFGAVSAESAALIERLPAVTVAEPRQRAARRVLGGTFGSPPDPAFFDRNNPLTLARTFRPGGLKIDFNCGTEDSYGFDAGAQALDKILTGRGIRHEFHLYPGGHNWTYFAEQMPDSLEFHSEAFGLDPNK
jgi:putative tributyrin esterase